jgi:hypothetical protein
MLYGFVGRKGSGKDTAAAALMARGFSRGSFAEPLKVMLRALVIEQGCDRNQAFQMTDGDLKEVSSPWLNGATMRHAMQTLGTQWGREQMSPDFWIRAWERCNRYPNGFVMTDVRFLNEVEAIKRKGGKLIRVVRPGLDTSDIHSSETLSDSLPVDITIQNDGTIQQLHERVLDATLYSHIRPNVVSKF